MLVGHMGVLRGDFPVQTPKWISSCCKSLKMKNSTKINANPPKSKPSPRGGLGFKTGPGNFRWLFHEKVCHSRFSRKILIWPFLVIHYKFHIFSRWQNHMTYRKHINHENHGIFNFHPTGPARAKSLKYWNSHHLFNIKITVFLNSTLPGIAQMPSWPVRSCFPERFVWYAPGWRKVITKAMTCTPINSETSVSYTV